MYESGASVYILPHPRDFMQEAAKGRSAVRPDRIPPYFYLILLLGLVILFLLLADRVGFREGGLSGRGTPPEAWSALLQKR